MAKKEDLFKKALSETSNVHNTNMEKRTQKGGLSGFTHSEVRFGHISLGNIYTEKQIRSHVDTTTDDFKNLMANIEKLGVLQPIIVKLADDEIKKSEGKIYRLIAGERRFRACELLGLETIPSLIFPAEKSKKDILLYQFSENYFKEDLKPLDKAEAFYDLLCDIIGTKLSSTEMLSKLLSLQINTSTKQGNHNVMVSKELSERGIALSTIILYLYLKEMPAEYQDLVNRKKVTIKNVSTFYTYRNSEQFTPIIEQISSGKINEQQALGKLKTLNEKKDTDKGKIIRFKTKIKGIRKRFDDLLLQSDGLYIRDKQDAKKELEELKKTISKLDEILSK